MKICSATYVVNGDRLFVRVYYDHDVEEVEAYPKPYCFMPSFWETQSKFPIEYEETNLKTIDTLENVRKYIFAQPSHVKFFRESMDKEGRKTYEADIPYIKRWMIDNNIICSDYSKRYYWDIEVLDTNGFPDSETASEPIVSITVSREDDITSFYGDEKTVLENFTRYLLNENVRFLVGWNSEWDKMYLMKRCLKNRVEFDFHSIRFFDAMQFYRYTVNQTRYSLSYASKEFNERKPYENRRMKDLRIDEIVERNRWDTMMTYKLDKKYGFSDLGIRLAQMSNIFPDEVLATRRDKNTVTPSPVHTAIILRRAREKGYVIPNSVKRVREKYEGAYIHQPKSGLYEGVLQYDFSSLYPNIIIAFNIAPYDRTDVFIPLVKEYLEGKSKAKDDIEYMAFKLLANSIYGLFSSPFSRIYSPECGKEVARRGKEIITNVIKFLEVNDYRILYADTDSVFIIDKYENRKLVQDFINSFIQNKYNVSNIEMKFEGYWSKILFPKSSSGKDVKKRYCGIMEYDKGGKKIDKLVIVGLEHERGDWCELAKTVQLNIIKMILEGKERKEILSYVKTVLSDMRKGKYDNMLVLSKSISKPLEEYKVKAQHVKALLTAIKEGYVVEDFKKYGIINYVICRKGVPKIVEMVKGGEIDYEYYEKNQILPIVKRLGIEFETFASIDQF